MGLRLYTVLIFLFAIYAGIGIPSLIIHLSDSKVECGKDGVPPLPRWVFISGIGYIVAAGCLLCAAVFLIFDVPMVLLIVGSLIQMFVLIWTIMGAISLWSQGDSCFLLNHKIWSMGTVGVFLGIIALFTVITQLPDIITTFDQ